MEERKYRTLIKKNHKFGENEYVQGRISGIQEVICDRDRNGVDNPAVEVLYDVMNTGLVLTTLCSQEQYDRFAELVEKHYPGLCVFDVK